MNALSKKPTFRQSRTRTLIQLGGLLDRAGILKEFNIFLGNDLQDMEHLDNAATLLGFVKDKFEETSINQADKAAWRTIGEAVLKAQK